MGKSDDDPASDVKSVEEKTDNLEDDLTDQVPTLAIHEKSSLQNGSGIISFKELAASEPTELDEPPHTSNHDAVLVNGEVRSPELTTKNVSAKQGKGVGYRAFGFGTRNQDGSFQKVRLQ